MPKAIAGIIKSKRDSDEHSSEREVGVDEFKTLADCLVLNEGRGLRRERGPRKAWEFTISLGSPIQKRLHLLRSFLYLTMSKPVRTRGNEFDYKQKADGSMPVGKCR